MYKDKNRRIVLIKFVSKFVQFVDGNYFCTASFGVYRRNKMRYLVKILFPVLYCLACQKSWI